MESVFSAPHSGSTVSLTYDNNEVEVNASQVTTSAISLIFHLNPDTIWLQETIGSRIHIPNEDGSFSLEGTAIAYGLRVNDVPAVTPQRQPQQVRSQPSAPSPTVTTPVNGNFHGRPVFTSVTSRKTKVKIVRARLTYAHNGKPNFENIDVIFVDIHEDSADVVSMLRAVQEQFGPNYVIVSNDGLEIKDSPGTRGTLLIVCFVSPDPEVIMHLNTCK